MPTALEREVEKRLQAEQIRLTRGRRTIIDTLSAAEGPLSAAELHGLLDGAVPLSSIYRSLTVLEDAQVLAPHHSTKGITRYELAEWLGGHHHHLVCIDCGTVEDVEVNEHLERQLEQVVEGASAAANFTPISHSLDIEGRCSRCR